MGSPFYPAQRRHAAYLPTRGGDVGALVNHSRELAKVLAEGPVKLYTYGVANRHIIALDTCLVSVQLGVIEALLTLLRYQ
jgi:hypothetical protein